jgi:autotransporter-associated beta strand protein
MRKSPLILLSLAASSLFASAQTTWSSAVLPGAPLPSDLILTSANGGTPQFELTLGAGGSLARIRARQAGDKDVLPFGGSILASNAQWGLMAGTALDDANPATDDRFYIRQAGALPQRVAPLMQVERDVAAGRVDVYAAAHDQWNSHLQSAVQAKVSHLTRYEPLADGSIKVRRILRFGSATVNGAPLDVSAPYFEETLPFPVGNFNRLAERLNGSGTPQVFYSQGSNIPQNAQTDIASTNGYAILYHSSNAFNPAVVGIVFGKTQMAAPNQMRLNFSDSTTEISVRPGIQLGNAAPGAILDFTYHLVPAYALNSSLATRLNNLVASTPAPVLYPAGHAFTGELATIVQRLNDNLALPGVRSDRLGHDVTPTAVTARPMLLNGPEDDADIRARLAVFPQNPETLLQNYLYGTASQKQSATNYFFRYPGSGDGNGLRSTYTTEMGRALMWDMYRYDIAVGLGYATEAQKQKAKDLAVEYINAKFPYLGAENGGGGNLYLETYLAMGLAGLNFPEHPDSQLWISRSVSYLAKFLDTYFPDGAGNESPRYHDWSLELVGKFLRVMQRRLNVDLYDHPAIRPALDWFIRFSSPPLSLTGGKMVTPAWGDSTYSSNGGSHYYYDLSIFAPYYRDRDPDFSARLQDWWVRNGRPRQVYNAGAGGLTNILLLDPRLPTAPQRPNTSTYSPRYGMATLRDGTGSADEFFASFKCGANGGVHSDADMGHIDLFAFGVPLALDSTSGPYVSGTTFNETVQAHNTVRFNGGTASDTASGSFSAFGTSPIADYAAGGTGYGTSSRRHLVMMKGDYLVVWDETTASSFADWFFHVPGDATLEWQDHKVVSRTPRGADLDVHFVLPAAPLVEPTFPGRNISTSTDPNAVRNMLASQASEPTTPGAFTTSGESRFGDGSTSRNPFPFQWLKYFSVRNSPDRFGDFLTVLHPRKTGVTPELATELVSATDSAVTLRVTYQGRVDTIAITSSGATVTKGAEPPVQFSLAWPQSGVSGAAAFVKANFLNTPVTTLTNALATTGPVEVHTGELALGANQRIPDGAPLMVKPGGTFNSATFSETVGTLVMNGGVLKGTGALTASSIEWWGGIATAPVSASENFVKKGGADWSRPANLTYAGDTVIESGRLVLKPGASTLPGTGRVVLRDGTGLKLEGASAGISGLDVTGTADLTTDSATLSISGNLTGTGVLASSGNLDLSGVTSIASTLTLQSNGLLTLPAGSLTVKRLILNGVTLPAGVPVSAATHPGQIAGSGTIIPLEDIPVPTGLSGTATLGSVALTWNSVPGVLGYSVRRSTTPGGPYTEIGAPTSASFNDSLVTDAVVYHYVVAARDGSGTSANSSEIAVTASGPWYFDPNGATEGSVVQGGSYDWVTNSWTKTPGGTAATEASAALRHVQFAATSPGLPLAYSVAVGSNFSGAAHGFRSLRLTQGTVTFTGTPGNFYFTQPPVITADAGTTLRFAQTGALAFNLNNRNVTFDGAGTTLVSNATVITNGGSITKSGSGTLVLAAPNTFVGNTIVTGGTLRLATTDLPALWLDATKTSSLALSSDAVTQWNDANARGTFLSQASAANRPLPITDPTLAGPARTLIDFGAFNATSGRWMQMGAAMTDIRALFWVGKTTNENFLLGSTGSDYPFHSGGAGLPIWSSQYASANVRNGTTWLNGSAVPGTTTNMPSDLVRVAAFTTANVNANALGRDRTFRYGGIAPGEVMVFNTTLTTQQQADIDAYLAKKWFDTGDGIGNRLPTSTVVSLSNGSTLDLTGINFQTLAGLDANDNSATRVDLGAADLSISGSGSTSFDGIISGTGGLRKNGSGQFTLEGPNTYTGPTTVEGGTLVVENAITSNVTVKSGATLVNNGSITGNVIIESGGTYLGDGTIIGDITTSPPGVTITSPTVDHVVLPDLGADLHLDAAIIFNSAFGTPSVAWSMVAGPGTVTFENPNSSSTTARFSTPGSYTLRCIATVNVDGQLLQGSAERIVQPGGPAASSFTATFRQGENGYSHPATFIRGDSATWNSGARDQFLIGRNNGGLRGLFAFDLAGVPANATITGAEFELWIAQAGLGAVDSYQLRPLLKDFVEGSGNSSTSSTVGSGSGADWNSRTGPTTANLWDLPGGQSGTDFSPTVLGSLAGFDAATTAAGTRFGFTLDPAFITEANAALAAARPLRLLLTMTNESSGGNRFARFASDDHATVAQRPRLTLHFSTANPALLTIHPGTAPAAFPGTPATLTGNVAGATTIEWSLVSGPGTAAFADPNQAATTVTFSQAGTYLLRLTATNAHGTSSLTLGVTASTPLDPAVFDDWRQLVWPGETDPAVTGPDADPDRDGLANFTEWALHLDATAPDVHRPSFSKTGAVLEYTYTRRRVAPGEATWQIEWSDTLANDWSSAGVLSDPPVPIDGTSESVRSTIPAGTNPRRFLRLKVLKPLP